VLLIWAIINKTSAVPTQQRAPTLRLLALGAFGVGVLGIVAWLVNGWSGGQRASTRGNDSPAVIGGGNVTIGPASALVPPVPRPQGGAPPNAAAQTGGDRSPAIVSGGDAVVATPNDSLAARPP